MHRSTWAKAPTGCGGSASSSPRTRCLSLIEIARLSDPQRQKLGEYGQRWSEFRSATGPCHRAAAEAGVERAYVAAGLAPPRDIVWGGGPLQIANDWACSR